MKLLSLDTSSVACSVALQLDDDVTTRYEEQPREHTRLLLPMIRAVLDDAKITPRELDAIVLGNGPGSFIGMRIAASVAQGLAHGAGLEIIPESSLAAVAAQVFATTDVAEVVVAQDAHMQEVYLGAFQRDDDGLPAAVMAERLQSQDVIAELGQRAAGQRAAAGDGWQRYPQLLQHNRAAFNIVSDVLYPHAQYLLPLGARALAAGQAVGPAAISPAYLRQKVAEKPAQPS